MARGFESKDVEFQQAEAGRQATGRPALTAHERANRERRHAVQLTLARLCAELDHATAPAHRQMLHDAIATLEREQRTLSK
ncbi:MAG: hypothetical protein LBQ09_08535 [Acidobacteriaceae bacterium]|jgi:hypothetical protein|nr:hypothetical protein [Acidobacteriaceae bacterium]